MIESARAIEPSVQNIRLKVTFPKNGSDEPKVTVLIDGKKRLKTFGKRYFRAFDPDEILGPHHPLLPTESPRRVAVYSCSCGVSGCGVAAPVISADEHFVRWTDFRDYTGHFDGAESYPFKVADKWSSDSLGPVEFVFDRSQYVTEITRAMADMTWESESRRIARLLRESLVLESDRLATAGYQLGWVAARNREKEPRRWDVELRSLHPDSERGFYDQTLVSLLSDDVPEAEQLTILLEKLRSTDVKNWPSVFTWSEPGFLKTI